jgi:hypothetical protein
MYTRCTNVRVDGYEYICISEKYFCAYVKENLFLYLTKHNAMKTHGKVEVQLNTLLN